jgi:hypothetical protein
MRLWFAGCVHRDRHKEESDVDLQACWRGGVGRDHRSCHDTSYDTCLAQQVISEPGYCAFFYPNANCQNKGPGNPYTDPRRFNQGYLMPDSAPTVGLVAKKRAHRSRTSTQ